VSIGRWEPSFFATCFTIYLQRDGLNRLVERLIRLRFHRFAVSPFAI